MKHVWAIDTEKYNLFEGYVMDDYKEHHDSWCFVYKDENQRFVFRGLYEVNEKDPQFAKKIFGQNCELNVLNINNMNNFYNYSLSRGDFIKYKLLDEKIKKFNDDIVLVF